MRNHGKPVKHTVLLESTHMQKKPASNHLYVTWHTYNCIFLYIAAKDVNPKCLFIIKDSDITGIPEK